MAMADEEILRGLPSLINPSGCMLGLGLVSGFLLTLGVRYRAVGEGVLDTKVVGRLRCSYCCKGCPTPGAGSWGELGKLLSLDWARFGFSIALAMSMLEKLPVQGVGAVSNTSGRLENMGRKAAPTEDDRLEVASPQVSWIGTGTFGDEVIIDVTAGNLWLPTELLVSPLYLAILTTQYKCNGFW